jgi:ribulose-phosphate 3-epimerase
MFEATSWFDPKEIGKIENLPDIELHLMVLNPMPIIELSKFYIPTLKRVIIHAEIDKQLDPIIAYIKNLGLEVGLALNPETKLKTIKNLANQINSILIMGVHPGASNQQFLGRKIIRKIKKAKKTYPFLSIEVDGGINEANSLKIIKAGADKLCVGSAIWQSKDPIRLIKLLSPTTL